MQTHGHSRRGHVTATYRAWASMKSRCYYRPNRYFFRYGGRGVTVCARWLDNFEAFLSDMGEKPKGLSLDRIDNNGRYEPNNCQWATPAQQSRNTMRTRMITFDGVTLCMRDWATRLGLNPVTLLYRFKRGETVPHAMRKVEKRKAKKERP
jgi:hypothetical protein